MPPSSNKTHLHRCGCALFAIVLVAFSAPERVAVGQPAPVQPAPAPVQPAPVQPAPVQPAPEAEQSPDGAGLVPVPAPVAPAPAPEPTESAPPTSSVLPGEADGLASPDASPRKLWLWPLRALLFGPRLVLEVVDAPVRGGLWLYEAYDLGPRTRQIFFNEDGTIGMFPLAFLETGFGLNAGARFVHRDLFGEQEKLNLRAGFGGRFQQLYQATFSSENRWPFNVVARGELEIRPKDVYYGIGQTFDVEESRFSQLVSRVLVSSDFSLGHNLSLQLGGSYTYREFDMDISIDDAPSTAEVYPDDALAGVESGVSAVNGLVRLSLDTRRSPTRYESAATPSQGWLVSGFTSMANGVGKGPSKYVRIGADVQGFLRLLEGPRALALRLNYDQVHGDRENIPFTDLPRIGGRVVGRGFQQDRFRDKAALVLSAEYEWSLSHMVLAALFVDYGRVAPNASDLLSEFDDYALGGGLALQAHTAKSFLVRASLAGSEEGLFFNLSFDPQFGPTNILEQK